MGSFDTILFRCRECKKIIKAQTKGGDCMLKMYRSHNVPVDAAGGIVGTTVECEHCGSKYEVRSPRVRLHLGRKIT